MPAERTDCTLLKQGDLAMVIGLSSKEGFAYNHRIAEVVKPPLTSGPEDRVGIKLAFCTTSALPQIKVKNSALRPIFGSEDRMLDFLEAVAHPGDVESYRRLVNKPAKKQAVAAPGARLVLVVQDSSTGETCPSYPVRYPAPLDGKICMSWLDGWDARMKLFLATLHARPDYNGSLTLHFPDEILIVQLRAHSNLITTVAWQEHFGEQFSRFCMAVDTTMLSGALSSPDSSDQERDDEKDACVARSRAVETPIDHEASAGDASMPPPSARTVVRASRAAAQAAGTNAEFKARASGASGASGALGAVGVGANRATVAAQLTKQDKRDLQAQAKAQAEARAIPTATPYGADLTAYKDYKDFDRGYMQPSAKWQDEDRNKVRAKGCGFDHLPPYPVHSDGSPAIPTSGGNAESSAGLTRMGRTERAEGAAHAMHAAEEVEEARMLVQAMLQGFSRAQAIERVVGHKKLQRGAASTNALGQMKREREQCVDVQRATVTST